MEKKIAEVVALLNDVEIEGKGRVAYTKNLPSGIKAIKKENWPRFWESPGIQFIIEFSDPINCEEFFGFCSQKNYGAQWGNGKNWFLVNNEQNMFYFFAKDNRIITMTDAQKYPHYMTSIAELIEQFLLLKTK